MLRINSKQFRQVADRLANFAPIARSEAETAVREALTDTREFLVRGVAREYALSETKLREHALPGRVVATASGARGSIVLQVRPVSLYDFGATVEIATPTFRQAFGLRSRPYQRKVARVRVRLYRGRSESQLPNAFALTTRKAGPLRPGDRVRQRVKRGGRQLTGFRYYTFPRRILEPLLREARRKAGSQLEFTLSGAISRQLRRQLGGR